MSTRVPRNQITGRYKGNIPEHIKNYSIMSALVGTKTKVQAENLVQNTLSLQGLTADSAHVNAAAAEGVPSAALTSTTQAEAGATKMLSDSTRSVRMFLTGTGTAKQLSLGLKCRLHDNKEVFGGANVTASMMQHALITGVTATALQSPLPVEAAFGMNLFKDADVGKLQNNAIGIKNLHGWLYANNATDFGLQTGHSDGPYTNLMQILPFEHARLSSKVYDPSGLQNNRFIETYGGFDKKALWNNIVPFPEENYYYVDKSHVVMKVIRQNWDSLGVNLSEERLHDNKYYKLSSDLVDHVITKLSQNVLESIPFSNLQDLHCQFKTPAPSLWPSPPDSKQLFTLSAEVKVDYMFPQLGTDSK